MVIMSGKGGGPAIGVDLGTTNSCVGKIVPNDQDDAKKQKEDEEAKQLLVDMIVNETIRNTNFMQNLRKTKVDTVWDEKRKQEKEELKKKRDETKKKREEQQKNKQDKAMGKKKKK